MIHKLRTSNPSFSPGNLDTWTVSGNVVATDDAFCSGFFSALFAGDSTGAISQTKQAFPARSYRLLARVGSCGGNAESPVVITIEFLSRAARGSRVLRRVVFTVDAADIPDICNATPAPCLNLELDVGDSPAGTARVRLSIEKPVDEGADIVVDSIYLIETAG
ncbi:MAG: hypothetical protein ACOY94_02805 [Bacillota bacterium]